MSGKKSTRVEPEGQEEELTVFVMRFKGTGETMRRGFDTVSQALQAMGPAQMIAAPPKILRRLNSEVAPLETSGAIDNETEIDEGDVTDSDEPAPTSNRSVKKQERKAPKIPNLINDLDYQTPVALADYVKEKNPTSINAKYLVVAAWFKHHRNTDEITVEHIFTCFSLMSWKDRPEDMAQVFRNIKNRNQWFDNGAKPGSWKLTIKGLNQVDNKMGLNSAKE